MNDVEAGPTSRVERWREETSRKPDSAVAHFNLGLAYTELGRMSSAESSYRKALELDPDLVEGWINLGGVLLLQWRFEAALEATREATKRVPDSVLAHFNQGQAHLYMGNAAAVVESNRRVLELDPDHAGAHYFLAVGLLATDRVEEAREELARATRLGHRPTAEFLRSLERAEQTSTKPTVPIMEIGADEPDAAGGQH